MQMIDKQNFRREIAVPKLQSNVIESTYSMFCKAEQSSVDIGGERGTYASSRASRAHMHLPLSIVLLSVTR